MRRWRISRQGITRTVLLTSRWAVKLPSLRTHGNGLVGLLQSFCRGVLANQSEIDWHGYKEARGALCPIRWHGLGGVVVVMPRCHPILVTADGEPVDPLPQLHPRSPGDNKPENYGVLRGRIVRIDYDMSYNGCPHDRSGAFNRPDLDLDDEDLDEPVHA